MSIISGIKRLLGREEIKEYNINGEDVIRDKDGDIVCACCGKKMILTEVGIPTEKGLKVYKRAEIEKMVGRNEPCPCGSGKKFKKCCGKVIS